MLRFAECEELLESERTIAFFLVKNKIYVFDRANNLLIVEVLSSSAANTCLASSWRSC